MITSQYTRYDSAEVAIYPERIDEKLKYMVPQVPYTPLHGLTIHRLTIIPPHVELFNIEFRVHKENGHYHLTSDQWPILTTFGDSFQDAVHELQELMKDLIQEYVIVSEEKLSPDSIEFRNFLLSRLFQ
ncbi:MAG: hypothetical protein V1799_21380 [bacterium]